MEVLSHPGHSKFVLYRRQFQLMQGQLPKIRHLDPS